MEKKTEALLPFTVMFGEREIGFNAPSEGQMAVIALAARRAKRGGSGALEAVGLILDVIDKMVTVEADRDWLEDGLVDTSIGLDDFIGVLDGINAEPEQSKPARKSVPVGRVRSGNR